MTHRQGAGQGGSQQDHEHGPECLLWGWASWGLRAANIQPREPVLGMAGEDHGPTGTLQPGLSPPGAAERGQGTTSLRRKQGRTKGSSPECYDKTRCAAGQSRGLHTSVTGGRAERTHPCRTHPLPQPPVAPPSALRGTPSLHLWVDETSAPRGAACTGGGARLRPLLMPPSVNQHRCLPGEGPPASRSGWVGP